ncbi:MAG: RrF2 family transcriptional regulator [Acidobacteriota bacterium]
MIRLSKRTDYGLIAIRRLSSMPGGAFLSAREIAAEYRIPPALMAKLLQRLARRGLVASHHGTKGGYQIARPVAEISLWEVIEAIEGPICLIECQDPDKGHCPQGSTCTVQRPLLQVQRKIARVLEGTTLGDL